MSPRDRGPAVVVVGGDTGPGVDLVAGLEDQGASVAVLGSEELDDRDGVGGALDGAARRLGGLDGVVVASVGISSTLRGALGDLGTEVWQDRVEVPLLRTLVCFQAAYSCLRSRGGTMVLLVPTLSLTGAAGFVPWAAVTEGQRALAKAAARAWGPEAVTVNCVAVPAALLAVVAPGVDRYATPTDRPRLPAPALARPAMRGDVAPVVSSLLSPIWRAVTGATVAVDAGVWMTP
jgi:3-oxoacyl-[acyl-carrier protein] reductase